MTYYRKFPTTEKERTKGGHDPQRYKERLRRRSREHGSSVYGAGHPMGPFRLMDLTGIDLNYIMSTEKFRKTGDFADLPAPSVVEKYVQGYYGEKTGKGWYDHPKK